LQCLHSALSFFHPHLNLRLSSLHHCCSTGRSLFHSTTDDTQIAVSTISIICCTAPLPFISLHASYLFYGFCAIYMSPAAFCILLNSDAFIEWWIRNAIESSSLLCFWLLVC
jgi:hypothetical protein